MTTEYRKEVPVAEHGVRQASAAGNPKWYQLIFTARKEENRLMSCSPFFYPALSRVTGRNSAGARQPSDLFAGAKTREQQAPCYCQLTLERNLSE